MSYSILIVDDSSITRAVLKKTIGMSNVSINEIFEAGNGREALDILAKENVDLILADLNMPVMSGQEMVTKILDNEETCHIPILVISTEASTTRIDDLIDHGVKGYIHKPFTPEQVRDELMRVLATCSA